MRFFDFLVYYPMASFKKRKVTDLTWQTPLERAALLAAISSSFLFFACCEVVVFLALRINIFDTWYGKFGLLANGLVWIWVFSYIYVKNERYEYIISSRYKPFRMGITAGVIISFLIFLLSMILVLAIGVIQGRLLGKHN